MPLLADLPITDRILDYMRAASRQEGIARTVLRGNGRHALEAAAARNPYAPVRLPVATAQVTAQAAFNPDAAPAVASITHDAIECRPLQVAISDLEVANMATAVDHLRLSIDHASRLAAAAAAEAGCALVDALPLGSRRDPMVYATKYTFYLAPVNGAGQPLTVNGTALNISYDTPTLTTASSGATVYRRNLDTAFQNLQQDTGTAATAFANFGGVIGNAYARTGVAWQDNVVWAQPPVETPEQRAAKWAQAAKLQVARQRADRLWLAQLTPEQRALWDAKGYVEVVSARGHRYRLKNYRSGNIFRVDRDGREVAKYCAYANDPGGSLPDGDHWYTQMLALKYDEVGFLRAANTWRVGFLRDWEFAGQGVDAETPAAVM